MEKRHAKGSRHMGHGVDRPAPEPRMKRTMESSFGEAMTTAKRNMGMMSADKPANQMRQKPMMSDGMGKMAKEDMMRRAEKHAPQKREKPGMK